LGHINDLQFRVGLEPVDGYQSIYSHCGGGSNLTVPADKESSGLDLNVSSPALEGIGGDLAAFEQHDEVGRARAREGDIATVASAACGGRDLTVVAHQQGIRLEVNVATFARLGSCCNATFIVEKNRVSTYSQVTRIA
jgi:hypothetical protein